jgi:hypothetical protein
MRPRAARSRGRAARLPDPSGERQAGEHSATGAMADPQRPDDGSGGPQSHCATRRSIAPRRPCGASARVLRSLERLLEIVERKGRAATLARAQPGHGRRVNLLLSPHRSRSFRSSSPAALEHGESARRAGRPRSEHRADVALERILRDDRGAEPLQSRSRRIGIRGIGRARSTDDTDLGTLWRGDQRRHSSCIRSGSRHEADLELQDRGPTGRRTGRANRAGPNRDHPRRRAHRGSVAPTKRLPNPRAIPSRAIAGGGRAAEAGSRPPGLTVDLYRDGARAYHLTHLREGGH